MSDDSTPDAKSVRLDHFVKLKTISGTGGQAKVMIQNGEVKVDGQIETRRRRKLILGNVVEVGGERFVVTEVRSDE